MNKYYIYLFLFAMISSGCASQSEFKTLSSKNVNLSNFQVDPAKSKGRVKGEDCTAIILVFPTGGPPTLDEAIDRAVEPKQANLLVDAVVKWSFFQIPLLFGQECWEVEGDAYDTYESL